MKCILLTTGKIIRVTDDVARKEVANGKATYTSKESWKKSTRPVVTKS